MNDVATPVLVGPVTVTRKATGGRVTTVVDGEPLWFESADADLDPGAEALAGTMALAAVSARRPLRIADPVSRTWMDNVSRAQELWHEWWGYPVLPVQAELLDHDRPRGPRAALCFTGGVDSFHSLLTRDSVPDVLVFVHGLAVTLDNEPLAAVYEPMIRTVAREVGARAVVMRTNVREHALPRGARRRHVVGGSLAAPGHLLAGEVGTLVVSSSDSMRHDSEPALFFGTHWELDPLWSSDRLTVEPYGADRTRADKLREIDDHVLVRTHLRVCNGPSVRNCSRCDKCVLTMVLISLSSDPSRWTGFDWSEPLTARLDKLAKTSAHASYPEILGAGVDPDVARSIRRLLERTAHRTQHASLPRRLVRRARRVGRALSPPSPSPAASEPRDPHADDGTD